MKTFEQIKEYDFQAFDGRDIARLINFLNLEQIQELDIIIKDEYKDEWKTNKLEFTRENILKQLEADVIFGFEKALDKRGISASCMYDVVRMWNWILEEGLEDCEEYECYGLPLFKATALKYGFDNPIGDDKGNESHYDEEC